MSNSISPSSKILVTGGTGFLGAYIISNLIDKGYHVRAIRRSKALPFFIPHGILEQVEWVEGNVLDIVSLQEAMVGMDALVHSAAMVSFDPRERKNMYAVNVEGTTNVVNMALEAGIKRLIHISSVAALGRTRRTEMVSEQKKWEESSSNTHYAISKHRAEMQVWRGFAEGLDGAIINPSTILGFGDWHQSSCSIFRNAYRGFPWYTNGINGFTGVEDAAEATAALLASEINHQRFVVNSENWSFRDLFNTIADNFKKPRPHRRATPFLGQVAWRMEALKSAFTGNKPLLTRETAKVAHSCTSFDNRALLEALPGFSYSPLADVIKNSCEKYEAALEKGELRP